MRKLRAKTAMDDDDYDGDHHDDDDDDDVHDHDHHDDGCFHHNLFYRENGLAKKKRGKLSF